MRKHGCSKERGARISHLGLICAADPYTAARGAQHPGVHAAGEGDASVAAERVERERSPRERDSSPTSPPPASPALAAMAGCPP